MIRQTLRQKDNPLPLTVDPASQTKPLNPEGSNQEDLQDPICDFVAFIDDAFKDQEGGADIPDLSLRREEV